MPKSFLVKSQSNRGIRFQHGIAKLVYDPTRAATVLTTLVKPEPIRAIPFPSIATPSPSVSPVDRQTPRMITVVPPPFTYKPRTTPELDINRLRPPVIHSNYGYPPINFPHHRYLSLPLPPMYHHLINFTTSQSSPLSTVYAPLKSPGSDEESHHSVSSPGSDFDETVTLKKKSPKQKSPRSPGQKFKCPDCDKEYCTIGGLNKHRDTQCRATQNGNTFQCKYCPKEYTALGALKMHLRTHTLPCKCKICGKAFSRPWLLQGHIRTHTGEKPFRCSHCHRAFADRSNLRAHLQTHSDVKRYSCGVCNKTFSRMSLLNKHRKVGCSHSD